MADQNVTLRLQIRADGTVAAITQVDKAVRDMGADASKAGAEAKSGFARAERGAQSLGTVLQSARSQLLGFFGIAAGAAAIRTITRLADEYTNLQSRIRLVTDSQAQANVVSARVFNIAQQTRSALSVTGELYTTLARSTADLGLNQQQLAQITQTVNQSFVVSGASADSARAAIVQLSQGLASGALRGDEFNSVAEQAPILLDLVAKSLGKSRGELREFAAQGGITAKILTDALLTGAADVQTQFDGMAVTIGGAATQIGNAFTRFVGETSTATGAASGLASVLSGVAKNFATIASTVLAIGTVFGVRLVAQLGASALAWAANGLQVVAYNASLLRLGATSPVVIAGLRGVTAAATGLSASLGPISLALVAVAAGIALVKQRADSDPLRKQIDSLRETNDELAEQLRLRNLIAGSGATEANAGNAGELANQAQRIAALRVQLAQATQQLGQSTREFDPAIARVAGLERAIDEAQKSQIEFARELGRNAALSGSFDKLPPTFKRLAEQTRAAATELSAWLGLAKQSSDLDIGKSSDEFSKSLGDQVKKLRAQNIELRDGIKARLIFDALQATGAKSADELSKATLDLIDKLVAENAVNERLKTSRKASEEAQRKAIAATEAAVKAGQAFAAENAKLAADLAGPQAQAFAEYASGIAQANKVLASGAISVDAFRERQALLLEKLNRTTEGVQAQVAPIDELIGQIAEEGRLIGLNNTEREVAIALRQAEQALQQSGVSLTSAEAQQQLALVEGMIRSNQAQQQAVDIAQQAAEDYQRAWQGATDSVARAFGDFVVSGAKRFKDLGQSLKSIAKSFLADLVAMFLRNQLVLRVGTSVGAGGGIGGLLGGGLQSIGNVFGAGGGGLLGNFGSGLSSTGINIQSLGVFKGLAASAQQGFGNLFGGSTAAGLGQLSGVLGTVLSSVNLIKGIAGSIGSALFGGKFKTTGVGRDFTINNSGSFGVAFEDQKKKGGLFGKNKSRTLTSALDPEVQAAIDALFNGVKLSLEQAANALAVDVPPLISGSFRQEFDKDGKLKKQFSTIAGKIVEESQEAFAQRLQALNIVGVIDKALGGNEASQIAQQFAGNAESLLASAQFLLAASVDVKNGFGLLGEGSLTDIAALVQDVAKAGEPLLDTYARLVTSSELLTQALALQNQSLDLGREQFVRFAADIVDAAGGLDRATSLWQDYFARFFSDNERAAQSLTAAQQAAQTQFGDIGLNASDFASAQGLQQFRALFEQALPTLGANAVVQWLEAAQAIGAVIDAQDALNQTLGDTTQSAEAAAQAQADLAELMAGVAQSLFELDASPLEIELANIQRAMQDTITKATALGASEDQLASIRELAARQSTNAIEAEVQRMRDAFVELSRAISDTRGSIASDILSIRRTQPGFSESAFQAGQISDLRGQLAGATDPKAQIDLIDQIRQATVARYNAELADIQQTAQAQDQAAQAAQQAIDAQREALARLRDFADGLGLSSNSPLTAFQRLDVAKSQFDTLLGRARGGDADAIGNLQQAAEALLAENRNVFGVSNTAVAEFDRVQSALRSVAGQGVSGAGSFSGFERASIDVSSRIAQLQSQAIDELQGLDDTLAALNTMQEADTEGTIQALRDRFEQAETHNEKIIEHIQPIFDAFTASNDTGQAQLTVLQAQSAQLQAISADLQNGADINSAFLDKFLVFAQQQETTIAGIVERLGRAIERNADAKVRA